VERFHILLKNTYNFDEKGFLIGISRKCKRIVVLAQLLMKQLIVTGIVHRSDISMHIPA
jgi:hypothetical protein